MGKIKTLLTNEMDDDTEGNLTGLAIVKAHNFSREYNPTTGRIDDRQGYLHLKEGYTAGFLAGFVYKITGETEL